jgi:hypothetical protein
VNGTCQQHIQLLFLARLEEIEMLTTTRKNDEDDAGED